MIEWSGVVYMFFCFLLFLDNNGALFSGFIYRHSYLLDFTIRWSKQINLHLVCCGVYQVSFFLMHQRQEILLTLNHLPPRGEFLILITRQPPSHHQAYRKSQ